MKVTTAPGGISMGTWNHRVIAKRDARGSLFMGVYEVHYNEAGNVRGWSGESRLIGESVTDLSETLARMRRALAKPILIEMKVGRKLRLIEMLPGGKEARGAAFGELPPEKQRELREMKALIEGAA